MTCKFANPRASFFLIIFIVLCFAVDLNAAEIRRTISKSELRVKVYNGAVITNSDSLILNDRYLIREKDYHFDYLNGVVQLMSHVSADSGVLVVRYTPLPGWLRRQYGRIPISAISPDEDPSVRMTVSPSRPTARVVQSKVDINGTKRFSILSQRGGSQFNQSLELSIKGEISPGVEIIGVVADRGYDPVYGTINSRISEVDKLNIRIKSARFGAQMGNLDIGQSSAYGGTFRKEAAGLQGHYQGRSISTSVTIARPRGRYSSCKLTGQDRIQGPYRIMTEGQVKAVIPGSEKVWLDGKLLERGADKDYTVDYPAATITFASRVPIDSRSRIEIDFEPLLDDYLRELYNFTVGAATPDSALSFRFGFIREGDEQRHLRSGELSQTDKNFLQSIGDSVGNNFRNSAAPDSNGAYIAHDSLGNRYFEYVGSGNGDYTVVFTSVGSGQGDYVYLGNSNYSYAGHNRGDYRAAIRVPVPSGENIYEAGLGWRLNNGMIEAIFRQSDLDRNLLSTINDNNNTGQNYQIAAKYGSVPQVQSDSFGVDLWLDINGKNYKPYVRQIRPDQSRRFFFPVGFVGNSDKKEFDLKTAIVVKGPYNVLWNGGYLDYADQFNSYSNGITLYPDTANSYYPQVTYTNIRADYDTAQSGQKGRGNSYEIQWGRRINQRTSLESKIRYERRRNNYQSEWRGTTEKELDLTVSFDNMKLRLERYDEDTLRTNWSNNIVRNRAAFEVPGHLADVKYNLSMVGQRFTQYGRSRNQLLGKLNYSYYAAGSVLAINGVYSFSDENRFERGIRFIEVEPGQGNYSYRDGQYIPDVNGNYIELEEVFSEQGRVSIGEKNLELSYSPSNIYFRFQSNINEEMLRGNDRDIFWVVPFITNNSREYQFRKQNYSGELKLFNYPGYYFVNLSGSFNSESRRTDLTMHDRSESVWRALFREQKEDWRYSQEGTIFSYKRDGYFNSPGNVDGYKLTLSIIRQIESGPVTGKISYRQAKDEYDSRSRLFIANLSPTIRTFAGGETIVELEGYVQNLRANNFVSYRLTDDYSGKNGIRWSVRTDYRIQSGFRFTLSIGGRHAESYRAQITGRGDLIASF
jgi:hypothetical protein